MQNDNLFPLDENTARDINYRTLDLEAILGVNPNIAAQPAELEFAVNWFIGQFKDECWPELEVWELEASWVELVDEDNNVGAVEIVIINPGTNDITPWQLTKMMDMWDDSGCGDSFVIGPVTPVPPKVTPSLRLVKS